MAGVPGITVPGIANNAGLQLALPEQFLLSVLSVQGDTAIVSAKNMTFEVRSEVPLKPGQTLYVSQEQGPHEEIRLHVIASVMGEDIAAIEPGAEEAGADPEALSQGNIPAATKQIDLLAAFRLADLPVTAEGMNSVKSLLKLIGELTPSNLLAAASFLKGGLASNQLLEAMAVFLRSLLASPEDKQDILADSLYEETGLSGTAGDQAIREAVLAWVPAMAEQLQSLPELLGNSEDLEAALQSLFWKSGAAGAGGSAFARSTLATARQVLGGQLYTWIQGDREKPCFYLPLFTFLKGYGLRNSELFIDPPAEEQPGASGQRPWFLALTLETDALGRMRFEISYLRPSLAVQALVERPETKRLMDDSWPLLANSLNSLHLQLLSHRCEIGSVESQAGRLLEIRGNFERYNPFDVSV